MSNINPSKMLRLGTVTVATAALLASANTAAWSGTPTGPLAHPVSTTTSGSDGGAGTYTADVDGDGAADRIKISLDSTAVVVAVTTASGVSDTFRVETSAGEMGGITTPYLGAGNLNRRPGRELVVLQAVQDCGHPEVLTWKGDQLALQSSPIDSWMICAPGSAPVGVGFTSRRAGKRLIVHQAQGKPPNYRRMKISHRTYRSVGSGWKAIGKKRVETARRSAVESGKVGSRYWGFPP